HLSWEESAAFPLAGLTAWRAVVTQAEVGPGSKVLVTGAGSGVSTFALLWAHHHGAQVYVTSGSAEKIEAACANGAVGGVNYRDEDWAGQLREMAGGFSSIIDSAGGAGVFDCLNLLQPGGRYVFFGATTGHPEGSLPLTAIFFKHLRIQGTTMGTPDEFRAMLAFMSEHGIKPMVDSVAPMTDAVAAFQRLGDFQQTGKVVLDVSAG
ncbi:MAG: zinc-binding dehydrogenase, partial [Gammaproteobacteria bacterium]|nr:zinc-binding dehydrogenase [Gammaproteobacteria bacterium]